MLLKIQSGGILEAQMLKQEFGEYFEHFGLRSMVGIDEGAGDRVIIFVPPPYDKKYVLTLLRRIRADPACRAQLRKPTAQDRDELEEVHYRLMAGDMVEEILVQAAKRTM